MVQVLKSHLVSLTWPPNVNTPVGKYGSGQLWMALLPAWLAVGWLVSKAQWFWQHKPDLQFGWIVLLLSLFLIWDGWQRKPAPVFALRWPGMVFALGGATLLVIVQAYQAAFGMMAASLMLLTFGLMAIVAANIHYVFGWPGIRYYAFPFLFLLIALPLPSALYNPLVGGLQEKVTTFNVELLNLFGVPARRVGSLIQLPNGTVGVDEACSGIRSLQSTVMATLFIGYLSLRSRGFQVGLFLTGLGLAFVGNLGRSLFLSMTANLKGLDSVKKVHDSAGWSIFLFTTVGVALVAWALSRLEKWITREKAKALEGESASLDQAATLKG